jgi:hypothetical protein
MFVTVSVDVVPNSSVSGYTGSLVALFLSPGEN